MSTQEIQQALNDLYEDLLVAGKVRTKGEFAELLGMGRNTVSLAMNGNEKSLTSALMTRVKALRRRLLEGENKEAPVLPSPASPERDEAPAGIYIPKETIAFYESLAKTAENLSAIVARLMPGGLPLEGKKAGTSPD